MTILKAQFISEKLDPIIDKVRVKHARGSLRVGEPAEVHAGHYCQHNLADHLWHHK